MAGAAIKQYNKILNLLDPPKDLGIDGNLTETKHGKALTPILKSLFWPEGSGALPEDFKAVGDTKNAIKKNLGAEGFEGKPLTSYIVNKANKLRILRATQSTGSDGLPTGLYISQDSGPGVEKLVKNAHIIITPGTIMDPASKTKENAYDYDVTNVVISGPDAFRTLPSDYIDTMNIGVLTGPIQMTSEGSTYRVKIPYNFGPAATNTGEINALLKHSTFKKATGEADSDDGDFFQGNDKKNTFIASKIKGEGAAATVEADAVIPIKKYILVKELGDTLQVIWLKYVIDQSDTAADLPYKRDITAIITGDTVVWYRAIVNKVPVILTYMGETNYWGAGDNEEVMIAAFKKTIRDQLITDNQCVIDIIKEISVMDLRGPTENWIWNLEWRRDTYEAAQRYLSTFAKKLENLNKDALIYVDKVTGIEATKEAAKKYHFNNPFVKKGGIWKTNEKVLSILPNGDIKFYAKAFKAPTTFPTKLANPEFFVQLPAAGGGQKGGARKNTEEKEQQASTATTKTKREKYYRDRIVEFAEGGDVVLTAEYTPKLTTIQRRAALAKTKRDTVTIASADLPTIDGWSILANSSDLVHDMLRPNDNVLYLFVRDYFPEVFTYAAMMKQAFLDLEEGATAAIVRARYKTMREAFPNVSLDVARQFTLEYRVSDQGKMLVTGSDAATPADTLSATKQALYLAHRFISYYDYMPSNDLLAFVNYCVGNRNILSAAEIEGFNTALTAITANNYAYVEERLGNQGGGGNTFDPILSSAMDNYELYYSLYVQAAYEDRDVTDKEFQAELLKVEEKLTAAEVSGMKKKIIKRGTNDSNPSTPTFNYNSNTDTIVSNASSVSLENNWIAPRRAQGGKSRYRKTQKKRKSSRKQTKRKTRRHKK
jgi:hypothetical protein